MRHQEETNMPIPQHTSIPVLLAMLSIAPAVCAAEIGDIHFDGSGFMTIGAGKMLGGTQGNVYDFECPCFISDYAQGAVYTNRNGLQWGPDSKLGLQGSASVDDNRLSLTVQAVARGARHGKVNLEWLYASYTINDSLTLQAGRKRLPMFYYSDIQDVGLALPWTHLPPQLYGWEAVNYNGINLRYLGQWGNWSATANVLAGSETMKDSGYWKIYNGRQSRTDVKWSHILGADLALTKDWLETRFVYIQSDTQYKNINGAWDPATQTYAPTAIQTDFSAAATQEIYGFAANIDYNHWLLRSEFIYINRTGVDWKDHAQIVGVGYHFDDWQPMLTWSNYRAEATGPGDPLAMEAFYTVALSLRYDLTSRSALKMQLDDQRDRSGPNCTPNYGDARLLTMTYDMIF